MSTPYDIAAVRQRLAERLAKLDDEWAKLAEELAESEAAERVLTRYARVGPARRRQHRNVPKPPGLSLAEATLRAVAAHDQGASADEVRKYLADHLGMQVRTNHLGMALQRHRGPGD